MENFTHKCPDVNFFLQKIKQCDNIDADAKSELWRYAKQIMDTGIRYVPRSFTPIEYNVTSDKYLNWRGKYTFGSVWIRGTHLQVHPDYGEVMNEIYNYIHNSIGEVTTFDPKTFTKPFTDKLMFLDYSIHFGNKKDFKSVQFFPISFDYFTQDNWLNLNDTEYEFIRLQKLASKYKHMFVLRSGYFDYIDYHGNDIILFTNDIYLWDKIRNEMLQVFDIGDGHGVEFYWH